MLWEQNTRELGQFAERVPEIFISLPLHNDLNTKIPKIKVKLYKTEQRTPRRKSYTLLRSHTGLGDL